MKKKIIKCIQQLAGKYSPTSVFFDWVQCMALGISNSCHIVHGKTWQQREELYKATISKYDKEERLKLAEMYGMLVMALEEGLGDTLGEIYMGSIGGDAGKGQFFTPYSLSLACASLTLPKENADGKVTVNEKDNAAFIQKNGKPIAVVISYERYERLLKSGIDINEF
ncbi:hypothetical protein [Ruminococcus callidus]|uniref:hypothetical protein n=1 Tax=Ruminococcus callidus TaxID=40519 RepID=UPI00399410B2